ncbi:vanadium-dependent haloperoxidase [Thermomonospora umbrina]|uniref:PAP2 superfamily protein n=1 Tax=Thermomonospora umbrina TaxID=111806 RepID=A0A3D9SSQ9_9ACTN|nr:vanadium-dependent haloperoxidase [Thermomonospora umbrina]REE97023.1 PAP2 superfamily protein [Thermomonospora umbrina]
MPSSSPRTPAPSTSEPLRARRGRAVLATAAAAATALTAVGAPPAAAEKSVDVAVEWYDATARTIAAAGATTQSTNNRTWAISWIAAARAVRDTPPGVKRRAYQDAALASAVHASLVALAPTRTEDLNAALHRTLERIPDGASEDRGIAAGKRQARTVLASREGDGLDPTSVNTPFPTPEPGPGVWQPTPPSYSPGIQAGNRRARSFLLGRADRFRLGPPPALGSARYRADLAEVRAYGSIDSTVRTPRQTETATFWLGPSLTLFTEPLRVALARSEGRPAARAALVALFHVALVDTQIATSDSKYAHLRWRPVTAIRSADIDGDPTTTPDPNWTSLHNTPAHPDYPSGHTTYAGAAERVLTALVGPRTAPFPLTSPTAPGVTRTYTAWRTLAQENVDARVWSGIHSRTADTAGVDLGHRVAEHTLRNADRLFR